MTADEITNLAKRCRSFMKGTKRMYDGERSSHLKGDMWFFELYHHLNDCAIAFDGICLPPIAKLPDVSTANAPFHPPDHD